jgi:hypothetical protein
MKSWIAIFFLFCSLVCAQTLTHYASPPSFTFAPNYLPFVAQWLELSAAEPNAGELIATQNLSRIQGWKPGQLLVFTQLGECCATQNVYDWSHVDATIASNLVWYAPYGQTVKVNLQFGWYTTQTGSTITTNTSSTGLNSTLRPAWFYSLAPNIQNLSDGEAVGSDLYDEQVSALSVVLSNLVAHELSIGNPVRFLSWGWEPDLGTNYAIPYNMVASGTVAYARSKNIELVMGEFGQCIYGVTTQWLGWANGSNWYDAVAFHEGEWNQYPPDGPNAGPNETGTRADQLYDLTYTVLGSKTFLMDLAEIATYCNATTDATNADSYVKAVLMLRKDGADILPYGWNANVSCPGPVYEGGYTNGSLSIVGQALYNVTSLVGNSLCTSSNVTYPFYFYEFGNHTIAWMAGGSGTTNMTLTGYSGSPQYVSNFNPAPSNTLWQSPIVLSGAGTLTVHP